MSDDCKYCDNLGGYHSMRCPENARMAVAAEECAMAELSEEDKQRQLQRKVDQSDLINWILHYKNPAEDTEKLRQIRLVME